MNNSERAVPLMLVLGFIAVLPQSPARRSVIVGNWNQCIAANGKRGLCATDDVNTRTSVSKVLDGMQVDIKGASAVILKVNTLLHTTRFDLAITVVKNPMSNSPPARSPLVVAGSKSVAGASTIAVTRCHHNCEFRGTCNLALGRCDCPPFYGGADCSVPLFPACVKQWGLLMPVAPCGIHTQPAFPSSCECVRQCHQLGLDARQECLVEPKPGQSLLQAAAEVKLQMGWMPYVANQSWLDRTLADAAASRADSRCSGNGLMSVQLPYDFYPKQAECVPTDRRWNLDECANQRVPKCRCFPGFGGTRCELTMDRHPNLHKCLNGCSGRGKCVSNWCHCEAGSWGADCSLGGTLGLRPTAPATGVRPRIYVYDVPPRFTSWLGTFRRGDWTRDHWYGVDVMLHQQLLRSKYRTLDPEQADFFFIPLHLSLGYYSHRYYFKHFTQPAAKPLRGVLEYIRNTWPQHWSRKGGKDHLIVMTQDQGNRYVRQQVRESDPLIMIHHWGAPAQEPLVDGGAQGDHRPGHDVTVPPFHGEQARLNRWMRQGQLAEMNMAIDLPGLRRVPEESSFKHDLFFSGKMNLNWGRHYSLGVRQGVYRAHRRHPRFLIFTFDNGVQEKLPLVTHVSNYASAKFCLAPAGYGFSSRQYECVLVGCVPVVVQDAVEMAFEDVLPWGRFSLRLNFSDLPILPQLLQAVPAAHVARLRRGLGCVWPRMLWLAEGLYTKPTDTDPTLNAARPYDAFETTMRALRVRLGGGGGGEPVDAAAEPWRAAVESCTIEVGDDGEFDLDSLRRQVRTRDVALSADALAMEGILREWEQSRDDKAYAMKTRFFPSGVKIPGVKWTD